MWSMDRKEREQEISWNTPVTHLRSDHTLMQMGVREGGSKVVEKWTNLQHILKTEWTGIGCRIFGPSN